MEIKLLDQNKKQGKLSFTIKGSNPAFASLLRRTIIEQVPTMAIEDVEFRKNNSVLYDEVLAHRLGLIVLSTDLKSYIIPEECKCKGEGCTKCQLKLTLKARGPGIVYASELKSKDPKVTPVFPKTPIVELLKGQVLELEATAVLGRGGEHAKWSPGIAYYRYKPVVDIKKGYKDAKAIAKSCPTNVFTLKNNILSINGDDIFKCHLCGACAEIDPTHIKLNESNKDFVFYIESWGQLQPKEIVAEAISIINTKLDQLTASR